jgi:hypothetical protein
MVNRWRKSSFSGGQAACVEVRHDLGAIRDSKLANSPELTVAGQGMDELFAAVARGGIRPRTP